MKRLNARARPWTDSAPDEFVEPEPRDPILVQFSAPRESVPAVGSHALQTVRPAAVWGQSPPAPLDGRSGPAHRQPFFLSQLLASLSFRRARTSLSAGRGWTRPPPVGGPQIQRRGLSMYSGPSTAVWAPMALAVAGAPVGPLNHQSINQSI